MNKLFLWAITSALAGFIFGFDLVVISGAEQSIQALWNLSPAAHGWLMSSAIWGTVLGSLLGGIPTEKLGRRPTLLAIGILYFISALGSAMAKDPTTFMIFRALGGVGIGISTVAAPLFIAEISPAHRRGLLTGLFQFNIVFGLLIATLSNALIGSLLADNPDAWRVMIGIEAVPALLYSVLCFSLPESPRWLMLKGKTEQAQSVIAQINPQMNAAQVDEKMAELQSPASDALDRKLNLKRLRLPLAIAFLVAFFNQLSGINAILGYAPRIFGMTGVDTSASLFNASLVTLVNLVFTFVGLALIDRLGRRTLLYIGSFGYIASLGICTWAFSAYAQPFSEAATALDVKSVNLVLSDTVATKEKFAAANDTLEQIRETTGVYLSSPGSDLAAEADSKLSLAKEASGAGATIVLVSILAFIAAHAIGQGTVIWVLISEIFPQHARSFGQSIGSTTHWVFAALLTQFFVLATDAFSPPQVFGFFCFMMILHLIWVKVMVPETKGKTLEELGNTTSA